MTDISADFSLEPEVNLTADFELNPNPSMEVSYKLNTFENDHTQLINRDVSGQHPISAITGLRDELDSISEDITLVEDNLTQSITDEKDRAELAESNLSDAISDEATARQTADNTLTANLANEVNARISADTSLTTLLGATNQTLNTHIADVNNPHQVTKAQIGLGNADNTSDMDKPISAATQSALDVINFEILEEKNSRIDADSALQYNIDAEALARGNADTALNTKIDNHIADKANPHQVTKAQVGLGNVDNTADIDKPISTAASAAFDAVEAEITDINDLIPNEASSSNQLADKAFVNSSIAANTANFIGTFNSVAELEAYPGTLTNNDYAFVVGTDSAGNTVYDRYKYTDATTPASWIFEYELNNSSFTAAQWNAINSGATSALIGQITTNQGNITTIQTTMSGYGNIVTHNVSEFATAAQGTKADTAVQPADLATVATTGDYDDLSNKPTIPVVDQVYNATSSNAQSGVAVASAINALQPLSAGNGINISSGVVSVTAPTIINNAAQYFSYVSIDGRSGTRANSSVSIAAKGNVGSGSISIGYDSYASGMASVAIGEGSVCSAIDSVAIGQESEANSGYSVAVGRWAKVAANCDTSIQLGAGLNNVYGTFQVGSYQMLEFSTGKIPNARINIDSQPTNLSNNAVSSGGVYTALNDKQDTLVSGTNIKTINNNSILGSGDLTIDGLPSQTGQNGKFLTTDGTNASWAAVSTRNIGEIVQSTIPLTDAGLHLLDGALLQGSGAYGDFVTYIAGLVSDYPDLFDTEANWQQSVTDYGVCGKFVYDSVNGTVRLPKIIGFTESTIDTTVLGDLVEAGLPNITGRFGIVSGSSTHIVTDSFDGAFIGNGNPAQIANQSSTQSGTGARTLFDASRSNSIYGNSNTVQPQAIKVLYYIVVANSTKTEIEIDIDDVMTDLNSKADVDLSNVNNTGKSLGAGWAMPSDTYDDLTLGVSGASYQAPANGWYYISKVSGTTGRYVSIRNATTQMNSVTVFSSGNNQWLESNLPVKKGDTVEVGYTATGTTNYFRFIYAVGSEWEKV